MAFLPFPGGVEVRQFGRLNGKPVEVGFWFKYSGAVPTAAQLTTLGGYVHNGWFTSVLADQSAEYEMGSCLVTDQSTNGGLQVSVTTHVGATGGTAGNTSSNQAAACITLATGKRGRSYRGRKYFPGIPESSVAGGLISTGLLNDLVSYITNVQGAALSDGFVLSVPSRQENKVARTSGVLTAVTAVGYSRQAVASQRRRRAAG